MSNGIYIVKRSGDHVPLNIDKIHFVVEEACKGLAGKNNPKARVIVLISPEGIVHNCHGTLKKKCNELGLSFATIRAALEHNRIPNSGTAKGWTVKYDI
jgi:hypothetical protein